MRAEGREHRVICAQLIEEAIGNHLRILTLGKAFGRRQVEQAQRLVKDTPLDLRSDIYVFVIDCTQAVSKRFRAEGYTQLGGLVSEAFSGAADRAGAAVLAVN
jgi:hypothetical protein